MQKLVCWLFIFVLLLSMAGCSSHNDESTEDTTERISVSENADGYDIMEFEKKELIKDCQKLEFGENCETYSFLYKSGGYWVKGVVSIPVACIREKSPCNCIVYNRGGNANMGVVTGREIAAICDATGRVVIASQYRGSPGSEGTDEFGGADVSDVITLIDLCENEFEFTKTENLCMVGVSRGGMMSYIAARQDERVKGIVAVSAVSDLVSAYNEREDMKPILESSIGGSPEEMSEEYAERSAINWAEEIDVPVYIIHSRFDEMVSFSQAEEMSEKLESLQKDVTLKIYEDDVHGFHNEDVTLLAYWLNEKLPQN